MVPDDGLQSDTMGKPAFEAGLGDSHPSPFPSRRFQLV